MTTGSALLAAAVRRLREAGVEDPARDGRVLLAHAIGVDRSRLTLVLPDEVSPDQEDAFGRAIEARAARQPVAQIIGRRAFYGRDFIVTGDVLDPRPETELLVDLCLGDPFETVLDLGTGSGCILLTLLAENSSARGVGTDLSEAALRVAQRNCDLLGIANAQFCEGRWFDALPAQTSFDLIVSNPPYIAAVEMADLSPEVRDWEPQLALTPGGDGLDAYREITAQAHRYLTRGGRLAVEIGAEQGAPVQALFKDAGFRAITCHQDLAGHDRVIMGQLSHD